MARQISKNMGLLLTNLDGPSCDRPNQEYGGVCIFVRKGIAWKHRTDLSNAIKPVKPLSTASLT